MIKITNITKSPVQLVVKTGPKARARNQKVGMACLNIPGIGAKKNVYFLEDERHTNYIDQAEKAGLIKQEKIINK